MPVLTTPASTALLAELGPNWRIQFADADGIPLNMLSFQQIDFGAISYKEIFQNVKTILMTPIFSAALERTLGIDQTIVDLPIDRAAEATIAILDALYFWENRVEVVSIDFDPDVLNGKLGINLQLKIKNVIYGTDRTYERTNIHEAPIKLRKGYPTMELPPISMGPPGPTGPQGPPGTRGSIWITDDVDPDQSTKPGQTVLQPLDMFLNTVSGDLFQYMGAGATATWVLRARNVKWLGLP